MVPSDDKNAEFRMTVLEVEGVNQHEGFYLKRENLSVSCQYNLLPQVFLGPTREDKLSGVETRLGWEIMEDQCCSIAGQNVYQEKIGGQDSRCSLDSKLYKFSHYHDTRKLILISLVITHYSIIHRDWLTVCS